MTSRLFVQLNRSISSIGKRTFKSQMRELKWLLLDKLVYSWLSPIQGFKDSVIRVGKWLPILWKDRDWDYANILKIAEHKIRFSREAIAASKMHTTWERDVKNMKIAEILLNRLQDSHKYVEKDWNEHFKNYPSTLFTKVKVDYGEVCSKDVIRMAAKERYMWNQDMDYLCKHLKKHLQQWWI